MTIRSVLLTDFDGYLHYVFPEGCVGLADALASEMQEHANRLMSFPYCVILLVAYPELDYANRWCWQQFGPAHGECQQEQSDYPTCGQKRPHSHSGNWLTHWLEKTDYNFGYSSWYFKRQDDSNLFVNFIPHITWGEKYPK